MNRELLRQQCEEQALGLLTPEEARELESLAMSGDRLYLQEFRSASDDLAQLALTAPLVDAPTLLRSRVLNQIRAEVRAASPPRRLDLLRWAGWAVAACLALFGFLAWREAGQKSQQVLTARAEVAELQSRLAHNRRALAIVMARDARFIRLSSGQRDPVYRAFWSAPSGLVLTGLDVPTPQAGRTFQLWVVPKKGSPISAGVFTPDAQGQVVVVAETAAKIEEAAALAISDEPAGGSPQPTTKPIFVGTVGD